LTRGKNIKKRKLILLGVELKYTFNPIYFKLKKNSKNRIEKGVEKILFLKKYREIKNLH
jgi:hypothetical protein